MAGAKLKAHPHTPRFHSVRVLEHLYDCLPYPGNDEIPIGHWTIFSRSNLSILNTTFLLSMAGITYLCVNPLTRAAYVLRCYYGESLCSGHDLLTELKRLRGVALKALVLVIAIPSFWLLFPERVNAAPGPTEVQSVSSVDSHGVSAEKLDKAIAAVMGRLEYSWRFPHNKAEEQKQAGFLGQAMAAIGGWLKEAWDRLIDLIELLSDWMDKILPKQQSEASSGSSIFYDRRLWIIICFVCVAAFFIWLLSRILLRKRPAELDTPAEAPSVRVEPDLANENISADELSSARWLDLAGRLREQGELRMALRAFYFATLAGLAEKELLTIARFKSNRDYDREIKRRAHFSPRQISAFSENVTILERIWYGMHAVQPEMLDRFLGDYKWITVDERKQTIQQFCLCLLTFLPQGFTLCLCCGLKPATYFRLTRLYARPLGIKAFYQGLEMMPNISVGRDYSSLPKLEGASGLTLFYMGLRPDFVRHSPPGVVDKLETLAKSGDRVVLAFQPTHEIHAHVPEMFNISFTEGQEEGEENKELENGHGKKDEAGIAE